MTLSSKDFQEKIDQVNKDLIKIQSEAGNDRKVDALNLYIDYLKDELKEAERAERLNKGT
jgi:hypothetical protein